MKKSLKKHLRRIAKGYYEYGTSFFWGELKEDNNKKFIRTRRGRTLKPYKEDL